MQNYTVIEKGRSSPFPTKRSEEGTANTICDSDTINNLLSRTERDTPTRTPTLFEPVRTKAVTTHSQGTTWEILPETEENGFVIAHVFGRHAHYYVRLTDLNRNTDRIRLYQKVRA